MEHKLKISQIVVEQERIEYEPSKPGELPKKVRNVYLVPLLPNTVFTNRIVHSLVDSFVFGFTSVIIGLPLVAFDIGQSGFDLFQGLVFLVSYVAFEYKFQATPGKMLTKCIVINEYGEKPSLKQVLGRTLIRIIPIEGFSFLGKTRRGWHDEWPETYVIRKVDLPQILEATQKQEEEYLNKKRSTVQN